MVAASSAGLAQTSGTRTSGFAYDAASGLLTREIIEPNQSAYRLQTDYTYDAFGNKVGVTVSGVDIATRGAGTTYDARGQFSLSATNVLGQSESWQYDARFGLPTSHTGPNGLTTTWSYDGFGRKTLEVRADGTRTSWSYQYCSGVAGGTASCPTGAATLTRATSLAADGATQIGPITTAYRDRLDRVIATDVQGFDGSLIRSAVQYDALGRVAQKSRPYFVSGGTPRWHVFGYDALGRPVTETFPDNTSLQHAYHGLTTSDTNALGQTRTTIKNSQGQIIAVTDALNRTSTYAYDPFGNLVQTKDPVGNVASATYDPRGRKIGSSDPDLGAWTYAYNTLDQVTSQTDAKGQVTTLTYDLLGRMTQRAEPGLTSTWSYDTAPMGIGKLAGATAGPGYQRTHSYDSVGRPTQVQLTLNGVSHTITTGYDSVSRISTVAYPSGTTVAYSYNALGYQAQLTNPGTGQTYWTANARDAELHLTQQTAGNGVVTSQSFDALTGRLTGIMAGGGGAVQNFSYAHDLIGRLINRSDANSGLSESFGYDAINRLTSATVGVNVAKSFSYDPIGNLLSKSDVGNYSYPVPGSPRPHAVLSISGGTINSTFSYDPNGNQTAGAGLTIAYTPFNKPASITRGTTTITFSHDPERQRYEQIAPSGTTLYLADPMGSGVMVEKVIGTGGTVQWNNYLYAGGGIVGMRVERSDDITHTRYFHKDHLGSISTITNETGVVVERLSYDAWGKRRHPDGSDDPAGSIVSQTTRGFTGHEQLAEVALVHMNGRVYDPLIGRFGSADPMTEDPFSTQGWNRYSYVGNSPLNFSDPSGYCFLGCFWKPIFKAIGNLFNKIPILGAILRIAAVFLLCSTPAAVVCAGIVSSLTSAFVAGVTSGKLGHALKAGFISAVTAVAFNVVGGLTGHTPAFGTPLHVANVAGHAAVGCAMSAASGGSCGSGALAGAVSAAATPLINTGSLVGNTAAHAAVGGLASVAGGGKFHNGAITGAFGYLFNACGGKNGCFKAGLTVGTAVGMYSAAGITAGTAGLGAPVGIAIGGLDVLIGGAIGMISDIIGDAWTGNVYNADVTDRPGGFRKGTVQGTWDNAEDGSTGGKMCPDGCGTEVKVAPGTGPRDWDIDHYPEKWADRDLSGLDRKGVLDNYNRGVRLRCPHCNRSDN